MITLPHERGNLWLRLKLLLTPGNTTTTSSLAKQSATKPKRRTHRTTAFFELP